MINPSLNFSKALYMELLRDELVSALRAGESVPVLKKNLDRLCVRLFAQYSRSADSDRMWNDTTKAAMCCVSNVDIIRRMFADAQNKGTSGEELIRLLLDKYGDIDSNDYRFHAAFFCQEFDLFTSFQSVWDSLGDEKLFKRSAVFVWENMKKDRTVARYIDENYRNYHSIGVPVVNHTNYDLIKDQPDVCFFMKPYYTVRGLPPRLHIHEVGRHVPFTVYISYCLDVQGGERLFRFFYGMPALYSMWKIIGYSKYYKEMATRHGFRRGENVDVIGHPKFDAIYEMLQDKNKWRDEKWEKKIAGRPVVLWNSHFSVSKGQGVGTFLTWYKLIFGYFREHKDIFLIWRPHPIFWQTIVNELPADEFQSVMEEVEAMDNVIVNKYGDYHYSFAMSDALISDAATFLVEYVPTGNPVMYTPKKDGEGVCDPNCTKELYIGDSEKSILDYLEMIRTRQDPKRDARMKNFTEEYGRFDGKIGERIRDHVIGSIYRQTASDVYNAVHGIYNGE